MSVIKRNNVQVLGKPDAAKTIVFAHGFGTDQTAWQDVAEAFADEYKIVLFDYVGANEKTTPFFNTRKYKHLQAYADDILDVLEELGLRQVTLIGHSVGGMTGALAAIQEPSWFSKLILVNASPRYVNDNDYQGGFDQQTLDELFAQMQRDFHAWAGGFAPRIMANADRPHLANGFIQTISAMRPDVALAIARVIFQSDHRADIAQLQHPTLLIQGTHDLAVPHAVGHYMENHMPNAWLTFIDAEGHLPHISHADKVVQAIQPFLLS